MEFACGEWVLLLNKELGIVAKKKAEKNTEKDVDELIRRILRVYVKVGMFEKKKSLPKGERNTKKHQNLARKMSEEGIVLLKNLKNITVMFVNYR